MSSVSTKFYYPATSTELFITSAGPSNGSGAAYDTIDIKGQLQVHFVDVIFVPFMHIHMIAFYMHNPFFNRW